MGKQQTPHLRDCGFLGPPYVITQRAQRAQQLTAQERCHLAPPWVPGAKTRVSPSPMPTALGNPCGKPPTTSTTGKESGALLDLLLP